MKNLLIYLIFLFLSFDVRSLDHLIEKNLVCKGKYQIIGYEFIDESRVIRHAFSTSERDYYKNSGTYVLNQKLIKLDVEGDIFAREISMESLELFIGVHLNNSKVGDCIFFTSNLSEYFNTLEVKLFPSSNQ